MFSCSKPTVVCSVLNDSSSLHDARTTAATVSMNILRYFILVMFIVQCPVSAVAMCGTSRTGHMLVMIINIQDSELSEG